MNQFTFSETTTMRAMLRRFIRDEEAATAIEYALIAGLIAVAIAGAATALGTDISELFGRIGTKLDGVTIP